MPSYQSPGVYVEEVDKGTKPIEAAGTSVAAFVGYTEKAEDVRDDGVRSLLGKPTLVTNWSQYVQKFGGFMEGIYMPDAIYGYFANGGGRCYVVSLKTMGKSSDPDMATPAEAVIGSEDDRINRLLTFRAKEAGTGGNTLRVEIRHALPAGDDADDTDADSDDDDADDSAAARSTFSGVSSSSFSSSSSKPGNVFNLIVTRGGQVQETFDNLTITKGERHVATVLEQESTLVMATVNSSSNVMPAAGTFNLTGGEVKTKAITVKDYRGSVAKRTGIGGLEPLEEVSMIAVPDLMSSYVNGEIDLKGIQAVQQSIIDYCEHVQYCFAILDTPPGLMPQEAKEWRLTVNYDSSRAAMYYPWIETADQTGANGRVRTVPPCGHVAGLFARTDETRGVHKAPANEIVRGALGLEVQITKGEHDELNPIGVNVIRSFAGRGIRVWGARTLSSDPSWRYINVRRLFNMVEQSIEDGTQWVVFEPNDSNLWARVERDITAFLRTVWRSGALFGTTPEQAFYVKCDAETNPPEVRDLGQLIVEVGLSPVKPAEFVIFRISQWAGPDAAAE